jgi:uncharacterized protein YdeI (YjbR/CyaY-like superfamily)
MDDVAMETNVKFIDDDITFNYTQNAYSGGTFTYTYITLVIFHKKKSLTHRIMGKGFYNIYLCFHHKSYGCFILHHQVLLEKKTVEGCVCGMLESFKPQIILPIK